MTQQRHQNIRCKLDKVTQCWLHRLTRVAKLEYLHSDMTVTINQSSVLSRRYQRTAKYGLDYHYSCEQSSSGSSLSTHRDCRTDH